MIPVFTDDANNPNRVNVYRQNGEKYGYIEPVVDHFKAVGPYFRDGVIVKELGAAKQLFFNNIKD